MNIQDVTSVIDADRSTLYAAMPAWERTVRATGLPKLVGGWCVWGLVERDGRTLKVPQSPSGRWIKTTEPEKWVDFEMAVIAHASGGFDGIGLLIETGKAELVGIDLDKCLAEDGTPLPGKEAIVSDLVALGGYIERSPSGRGLHSFIEAVRDEHGQWVQKHDLHGLEVYCASSLNEAGNHDKRFLTITGDIWPAGSEAGRIAADDFVKTQQLLDAFLAKWSKRREPPKPLTFDPEEFGGVQRTAEEVLTLMLQHDPEGKAAALIAGDLSCIDGGHSEADLSLCCKAAYYTRDPAIIDEVVRVSSLFREKWDSKRGSLTYGSLTIKTALEHQRRFYDHDCRGYDAWSTAAETATPANAVKIADDLAHDPSLSKTQSAALEKKLAAKAGVKVDVLRADVADLNRRDDGKHVIRIIETNIHASVNNAAEALKLIPSLRVRGGELVELQDGPEPFKGIDWQQLGYRLGEYAAWVTGDKRTRQDPAVLQTLLGLGHWPNVPRCEVLTSQPLLRLDGTILHTGLADGIECRFNQADFPEYAGTAEEAMKEIRGLLQEFPFESERDEAAAIAMILSAVSRPIFPTAPGFMVTANSLAAGKSYLAKLAAAFAQGGDLTSNPWPQRRDEQAKWLLAVLRTGPRVLFCDNMTKDWSGCDDIHSALTEPVWGKRLLGGNDTLKVSTRVLWIGTGNHVKPADDMLRRVIVIKLASSNDAAWGRHFDRDPLKLVQADRGRWVMAALKILQEHMTNPDKLRLAPLASYDDWSYVIRGALVRHGLPDLLDGIRENFEHDPAHELLERTLECWADTYGEGPGADGVTVVDAIKATTCDSHGPWADLRLCFEEIAGEQGLNVKTLGDWLGTHKQTIGGRRFHKLGRNKRGSLWIVLKA